MFSLKKIRFPLIFLPLALLFSACGIQNKTFYEPPGWREALSNPSPVRREALQAKTVSPSSPEVGGYRYGQVSWYGPAFHGKKTANGEIFDKNSVSAAHKFLPLNTEIEVENLANGKKLRIRINDRGPYVGDRVLDLSEKAATLLGYRDKGLADVRFRIVKLPAGAASNDDFRAYKQSVVQIASFKKEFYAEKYKSKLVRRYASIPLRIQPVNAPSRSFHVIAGPFNESEQAKRVAGNLKRDGIGGLVRSYYK